MFDRGAWLTVAALSVVSVGCAKRTDAEARRAFERALSLDPKNPRARKGMAKLDFGRGRRVQPRGEGLAEP